MKKFKHFLLTLLIALVGNLSASAQSYAPNSGASIIFYPVSDSYRETLKGFDCFYNTNEAYKNNKIKIKPEYRFKQRNGLTPFEEIEGHTFTVLTKLVENQEAKKLEKKAFLYFLRRDDGEKLLLRVPYIHKNEDNELTHSMSIFFKGYREVEYHISLPCCLSEEYDYIKSKFVGKDIMYYRNTVGTYYEEKYSEIKSNTKKLQSSNCESLFISNAIVYRCSDIGFYNIASSAFKQPLAVLKSKKGTFYIPTFDFRPALSALYDSHYSFKEYFEERNILFEKKYESLDDSVKSLVGKYIVYDAILNSPAKHLQNQTYTIEEGKEYKLQKKSRLYCEKIDFSQTANDRYDLSLYVIMKDDSNTKIQIPADLLKLDSYGYYGGIFSLEDKVLARKKKEDAEKAEKDSIDRKTYNDIKKKYGNNYATYYNGLDDYDKEKFRKAVVKWGPSVAKDICKGYVSIGWNKEKCRMSWGEPKDINRSVGSWGIHEQWCYHSSYLYFENGILTSIQN